MPKRGCISNDVAHAAADENAIRKLRYSDAEQTLRLEVLQCSVIVKNDFNVEVGTSTGDRMHIIEIESGSGSGGDLESDMRKKKIGREEKFYCSIVLPGLRMHIN